MSHKQGAPTPTPTSPGPAGSGVAAPAPNPLTFNPSIVLAPPVESRLLDFFLNIYRTPPFLLPIYIAAAESYEIPWPVLAAINEVESDYGYNVSVSSAGAEGWMQFLPETWLSYGVDASGAGLRDPYNPADAIFATARYLAAAGAAHNLSRAIYAYNHSQSYVESVLLRARLVAGTPQAIIGGLTALADGRFPVQGAEPATITPVWSKPQRGAAGQAARAGATSTGTQAGQPAPPPWLSAASGASSAAPAVTGAEIAASRGAPLLAVQGAEVTQIGHNSYLGRFIRLRDAYGDTYTYARLGRVVSRYMPSAQPASGSAAGDRAVPLRPGTWVAAGTMIAVAAAPASGEETGQARAHFLFEIQPASAGAIDPRPLLQAWQLLDEATGHPHQPANHKAAPLFGPQARNALIQEITLMSKSQLQNGLLANRHLHLAACARHEINAGRIDKRVLTAMDFLLASGLDPTVSWLACGEHPGATSANTSAHSKGDAVTISAINGIRVSAAHGPSSPPALALRRLLALPGSAKPQAIAAPVSLPNASGTVQSAGGQIDVSFGPSTEADNAAQTSGPPGQSANGLTPGASTGSPATARSGAVRSEPQLDTGQWRKLISRISQLPQPHVPAVPTAAAVPDNANSPPPVGSPPPAPLPLASATAAPRAARGETKPATAPVLGGRSSAVSPPAAKAQAPPFDLSAPLAAPAPVGSQLELAPPEEELAGTVHFIGENSFRLEARPDVPEAEIKEVRLEGRPTETATWQMLATAPKVSQAGEPLAYAARVTLENGLYDLRAVLIANNGEEHDSAPLPERLVAAEPPIDIEQLVVPAYLGGGKVNLQAAFVPRPNRQSIQLGQLSFEWAPAGSGKWTVIATEKENATVTVSFDTASLPNGRYDLRVSSHHENKKPKFLSIPLRDRLIDNTPPTVELTAPGAGSTLAGPVELSANAKVTPEMEAAGLTVSNVTFWRREVGETTFKPVGEATLPTPLGSHTFVRRLHSETLPNGTYEFQATATDLAGNTDTSAIVKGVRIENREQAPPVSAHLTGVATPVKRVTLLGAVQGNQHETWAYGFTSAPPAVGSDGSQLPYTAQGEQLVLLRYTDSGGWQIADVLREPGGAAPFPLLPPNQVDHGYGIKIAGEMTDSGEAWLWFEEHSTSGGGRSGLFRRVPGGHFELDEKDPNNLVGPRLLRGKEPKMSLGQTASGQAYGILTNDTHEFWLLNNGGWERQEAPAPPHGVPSGEPLVLKLGDVDGRGTGWAVFEPEGNQVGEAQGLILGHFEPEGTGQVKWSFVQTGLDALDLTGAALEKERAHETVTPKALKAEPTGGGLWVEAEDTLPGDGSGKNVVARLSSAGRDVESWCSLAGTECDAELGAAKVPSAIFSARGSAVPAASVPTAKRGSADAISATAEPEPLALALKGDSLSVFAHGTWNSFATPGYSLGNGAFSDINHGWLGGSAALGQWSEQTSGGLTSWPLPDRWTLTSVAVPPGGHAEATESGAVAVGLRGAALRYDSASGWQDEAVPGRAGGVNLLGVAFAGPSSAFAVGQFGAILHWDGTSWSEDPQSFSVTEAQLNAVAFAPSGEGWAVGSQGTILHYDGRTWTREEPPGSPKEITSVTVAGSEVFAVADGSLIARSPSGGWRAVSESQLPGKPKPPAGSLRLVAGLPDGGLMAAGKSIMLVRDPKEKLCETEICYTAQPFQGTAVALGAFRQADGKLGAFLSVAPNAQNHSNVAGFPAGDGELLRQTNSGWLDLSDAQFAGSKVEGDGAVKTDPALAVATGPSGEHAWAVGGYAGTEDAAGRGTAEQLPTRALGWQTASIWRYDTAEKVKPPALNQNAPPGLAAKAGTVSFAFFSSPICKGGCSQVVDAQPDVNLSEAAKEIRQYANQPGGPAFAVLGGDARGPKEEIARKAGAAAEDFPHLRSLLAPLDGVPTFAALGPLDYVPGRQDETQPWAEAFAEAPAPFGQGAAGSTITPVSWGAKTRDVYRFYSFDAQQNGGRVRVIVLDNAQGSLEASTPGPQATSEGQLTQMQWLQKQLSKAQGMPVVAIASRPLYVKGAPNVPTDGEPAGDGSEVGSLLAGSGVLAVFTTNGVSQRDEHHMVPQEAAPGAPQIPEYEGAALGYQQEKNNGVLWYMVSVNTQTREPPHVSGVPVIGSLALEPRQGLTVARSLTLQFEAVARRPPGSLATAVGEETVFQGYDNYLEVPPEHCGGTCVPPSYSFTSSEPAVGDFVESSGSKSPYPKLDASGHPVPSSSSGLFCAYNAGTTTVTITAGLLSYSLPVTVEPGGFGSPCGTVFKAGVNQVIPIANPGTVQERPFGGASAPPPPPPAAGSSPINPKLTLPPPPPPAPAPAPPAAVPPPAPASSPPAPAPPPAPPPQPQPPAAHPTPPPEAPAPLVETLGVPPAIVPPATPPVEPIPPGAGGWAQSPSAAKRREETRKHASQDAFTLRPVSASSGESSGVELFYVAVGVATLVALFLSARGMRPRSGARAALLLPRSADADERERRRRTDGRRGRRPGT